MEYGLLRRSPKYCFLIGLSGHSGSGSGTRLNWVCYELRQGAGEQRNIVLDHIICSQRIHDAGADPLSAVGESSGSSNSLLGVWRSPTIKINKRLHTCRLQNTNRSLFATVSWSGTRFEAVSGRSLQFGCT